VLQNEHLDWGIAAELGSGNDSDDPRLRVVSVRTITRGARTYRIQYVYHTTSFADYGHPFQILETGELLRATTYEFLHLSTSTLFIVGRLSDERVEDGNELFNRHWTYDQTTGFKRSARSYGITTTFEPDPRGNVARSTNGNGHTTTFVYERGVVEEIHTHEHTIVRAINDDGTVRTETRGGHTTTFDYDDLSQMIKMQPPLGNSIFTTYDYAGGTGVTVCRRPDNGAPDCANNQATTTTLDGFGRPIATVNSVGVRTTTQYDAEGAKPTKATPSKGLTISAHTLMSTTAWAA